MAEAFGAILRFLGVVLDGVYQVIPSYGVAIIILTILVRVVLIPLTVKQIRSMTAMQRLQPELKRLQAKYKGDRQKMNEELMKLYREHGVNPLGGCFPLLMQAPVFIALYSVLRATVMFDAALPAPTPVQFTMDKNTICRPEGVPTPGGEGRTTITCRKGDQEQTFDITGADQLKAEPAKHFDALPPYVSTCGPQLDTKQSPDVVVSFRCASPGGSGHLPQDGDLFADIVEDRSNFLGMHLACSPTQASSKTAIRQCTAKETSAGAGVVGYYVLVLLMVGTTYFQQRQMAQQASGPQQKQMQMMGRIMPLFLGFISLNIPAGVIIYWIVSNLWTIGQQEFFLKKQPTVAQAPPASGGEKGKPTKPGSGPKPKPKPKR